MNGPEKGAVDSIAQGQVWTGNDALERGLVDEIGGMDAAIAAAADLAGLEEGAYGQKYFEKELSPGEQFALDLMSGVKWLGFESTLFPIQSSAVERVARVFEQVMSPLLRLNDPKGVYAHCFCAFE